MIFKRRVYRRRRPPYGSKTYWKQDGGVFWVQDSRGVFPFTPNCFYRGPFSISDLLGPRPYRRYMRSAGRRERQERFIPHKFDTRDFRPYNKREY